MASTIAGASDSVPDRIRITRTELYERVWDRPMQVLAKEFGLSDRGLAKTCSRLDVPVPPRGYWAKLQAGKPVSKLPLPVATPATQIETVIVRTPVRKAAPEPPPFAPELKARIDLAIANCRPIKVPRTLTNLHPIISKWLEEDRLDRERERTSIYAFSRRPVSRSATDRRRLRLLSALFCEFERQGYRVSAEREEREPIVISGTAAQIKFRLFEPIRQLRIPLTASEKKESRNVGREWKQERRLSGELVIQIESHVGGGAQTVWRDIPDRTLEQQADDVAAGLVTAIVVGDDRERKRRAEELQRWNLEQERAEQERLHKIEAARFEYVMELATASRRANELRDFLLQIERRVSDEATDVGLAGEIANWIRWARSKADQTDPLLCPLEELLEEPEEE